MRDDLTYLTPEAKARVEIDEMLAAAGWVVQDAARANLRAAQGVAVREFVLKPPHGRVDYLLFVDGKAVGVIEAKTEGQTLTGVEWQSAKYVDGLPEEIPTALEARSRSPTNRPASRRASRTRSTRTHASREVFWFHRPETLAGWILRPLRDLRGDASPPPPAHAGARPDGPLAARRTTPIRNLEESLSCEPAARADPDGDRLGQDASPPPTSPTGSSSSPTRAASCSSSTVRTSAARR